MNAKGHISLGKWLVVVGLTANIVSTPLAAAQAPGVARPQDTRDSLRRAAPARRDTIYVAVQSPPPTITVQAPPATVTVEAPSQLPTILLGVATVLLFGAQVWIMVRQTGILDRQTTLAAQQAEWRRDEAIGTFYRIAFDLADEFKKADVLPSTPILANYDTHPRQMLREAARLFAPLRNELIFATTEIAERVDQYFSAVEAYNKHPRGRDGAALLISVQEFREQVGRNLDRANTLIPSTLRWTYGGGEEYDFRGLCSLAPALLEALRIEASEPTASAS